MRKRIGFFSSSVVRTLGLDIPAGTPIYIADSNIEHMKTSHPEDFEKYGNELENINYVEWKQRTERAAVALVGDVGRSPHLFHSVYMVSNFGCSLFLCKSLS